MSLNSLGVVAAAATPSSNSGSIFEKIQKPNERVNNEDAPRQSIPRTRDEFLAEHANRSERMQQQRETARDKIREMMDNPQLYSQSPERLSEEDMSNLEKEAIRDDPNFERKENRWLRNRKYNEEDFEYSSLADPGQYFDVWAQAYRMLGVYINCQSSASSNGWNGYYGYGNNNNNNDDDEEDGCQRWVIWASYVNPAYNGNGYQEYFTQTVDDDMYYNSAQGCQQQDDGTYKCNNNNNSNNNSKNKYYAQAPGQLDCHSLDTEWLLMGIYREQFYDFFEQVTKHVWYYTSYEYTVATSGLEYIGDADCEYVASHYGTSVYKAPKPLQGGGFIIGLYIDEDCLEPFEEDDTLNADNLSGNYYGNDNNSNNNNGYDWSYYNNENGYGGNTEEYTLTLFNEVFEEFKYCTLCLDYPSYQDGYFNGDGYDGDDLINQCWKFYSHDSYPCDSDCMALADAQGTVNVFKYGDKYYGSSWNGQISGTKGSSRRHGLFRSLSHADTNANTFFVFSAVLFAITCYLFYYYDGPSDKGDNQETLLDDDESAKNSAHLKVAGLLNRIRSSKGKNRKPMTAQFNDGAIIAVGWSRTSNKAPENTIIKAKRNRPESRQSVMEMKHRAKPIQKARSTPTAKPTQKAEGKPASSSLAQLAGKKSKASIQRQASTSTSRSVASDRKNGSSFNTYRSRSESQKKTASLRASDSDDFVKNHRSRQGTKEANKAMISVIEKHRASSQMKASDDNARVGDPRRRTDLKVVWEDHS